MSMVPAADEALMANSGKTFYRAARLLPAGVRMQVVKLYAFCRRVDDLADEPGLPLAHRRRSLQTLTTAFAEASPVTLSHAGWLFPVRGEMAEAAHLLVLAALQDLEQQQPASEQDLLSYAFGVAGTVGLMMGKVLGAGPQGRTAAVALGLAMQLSNIARDIREDFNNGRIYLPGAWVQPAEVAAAINDARQLGTVSPTVAAAVSRLLQLADSLYHVALSGLWTLPWRVRGSILAAAVCYREIGVKVGRNPALSLRRRTVVSSPRKLWLITVSCLRLLLPRFWSSPSSSFSDRLSPGERLVQTCLHPGLTQ